MIRRFEIVKCQGNRKASAESFVCNLRVHKKPQENHTYFILFTASYYYGQQSKLMIWKVLGNQCSYNTYKYAPLADDTQGKAR